jgi:hypothetical protein
MRRPSLLRNGLLRPAANIIGLGSGPAQTVRKPAL